MPPVIHPTNKFSSTSSSSSSTSTMRKTVERRPELFCKVKYTNTLPDIPFDPKFIVYPFGTNRFVEYKQTSLEKNYKHDLLTEQDLGVTIDLINPETYEIDEYKNVRLAEEDEKLLEDEIVAPQDTKRSRCHNRAITWLKKTEYISTEYNRYGASSDKTETKVGFGVRKRMRDENFYLDRDSQIAAINKTFESAKKPILSHPGKPGLKPVKQLQLFPDFKLWKYPFAQVMFDADPASIDKEKEMSQAMIRGVMDESGEQFVAYFLPTEDTMNKRKIDELECRDYLEGEEYEYLMSREYNWNVKNKATKGYEENYFFVWRNDCVCYNELETRVKLSKRRNKQQQTQATNSKLVVKHRPLNEQEYKIQEIRMTQLEPPQEEDDNTMVSQTITNTSTVETQNDQNVDDKTTEENNNQQQENEKNKQKSNRRSSASSSSSSSVSSSSSSLSSSSSSEVEQEQESGNESSASSSRRAKLKTKSSSSELSSSDDDDNDQNDKNKKNKKQRKHQQQKNKKQQQQQRKSSSSDDDSIDSNHDSDSDNSSSNDDDDDDDDDDDHRERTKQIFGSDSD